MKVLMLQFFKYTSVALLYVGLGLVNYHYFSGAIWPNSGMTLAVIILGGYRYLWSVLFGSIIVILTLFPLPLKESIILLIGITAAHIIEPLLGALILNKKQKFFLQNHNDYLKLVIFGGVVTCFIGSNISVLALLSVGFFQKEQYLDNVLLWWMGDTLGVMLLAPLILAWSQSLKSYSQTKLIEGFLLIGGTFLTGQIIFLGWFNDFLGIAPKSFILFLPITLIAIRLDQRGVMLTLNILSIQALVGSHLKLGCFANEMLGGIFDLSYYWLYIFTLCFIGMALTTYVNEIKQKERSQQALIDNFPFFVWLKDAESRFLAVNQAFSIRVGEVDPSNMIGKTDYDYSPKEIAEIYREEDRLVLQSKEQKNLEEKKISFSGDVSWWEKYKAPIFNSNGTPVGTVGFSRDISYRKNSEEKLRELLENERRSRIEQSQFMAMLAHELKTPLSVIRMALGSKSFSKDTLLHANRAISDIDNVVERCLQSERLADDSVVIKDEELCLYNIISNLCNINDAKKRFIININSSITIKTDAQLLNTILSNLIDNALKYSIPDSVISIDSSFEKNGLKIAIENAIKSSNFPDSKRVFQKYYRHKTAHNKTGSGLGLYLVKTISNLLGGDVIYDYYTNKVIFTLWLPL